MGGSKGGQSKEGWFKGEAKQKGPDKKGPAMLGPARLGPARLGPARLGPAYAGATKINQILDVDEFYKK